MKYSQHRTTTLAALLCGALIAGPAAAETKIVGSGASFPAPIYAKWFKDFSGKSGTQVDYQSKGSGGGIQDFIDETVDFAASDAAMSANSSGTTGIAKRKRPMKSPPTDAM